MAWSILQANCVFSHLCESVGPLPSTLHGGQDQEWQVWTAFWRLRMQATLCSGEESRGKVCRDIGHYWKVIIVGHPVLVVGQLRSVHSMNRAGLMWNTILQEEAVSRYTHENFMNVQQASCRSVEDSKTRSLVWLIIDGGSFIACVGSMLAAIYSACIETYHCRVCHQRVSFIIGIFRLHFSIFYPLIIFPKSSENKCKIYSVGHS